jgi:choline dehydrogenase
MSNDKIQANVTDEATHFAARVDENQRKLNDVLQNSYDFIVCGSGSSGSVVARRLAENPSVSVLLLEAGGTDDIPEIIEAKRWPENYGKSQDWAFKTKPSRFLNGRSLTWAMGKVLGGSSSINAMAWARGHKSDWDFFAKEASDAAWSYENVIEVYKRIENWHGPANPKWRGSGGLVDIYQQDRNTLSEAMFVSGSEIGLPGYIDQNGEMMEASGGVCLGEYLISNGRRRSIFRCYTYSFMDRPNLTVATHSLVTKVLIRQGAAYGIEVKQGGQSKVIDCGCEIILSLGAINTPKILMQSGIGDSAELKRTGIWAVQHLPGVGRNLQDHFLIPACTWKYSSAYGEKVEGGSSANVFFKSATSLLEADCMCMTINGLFNGPETKKLSGDGSYWSIVPSLLRPRSRGRLNIMGANPDDPVEIDNGVLSDPKDMEVAIDSIRFCLELGSHESFREFSSGAVLPASASKDGLEKFVRDAVVSFHHYCSTAKMGTDEMSVVDGSLKVYGIKKLRVADGSILPRVTTGNTMAPCVIVGERAATLIQEEWDI